MSCETCKFCVNASAQFFTCRRYPDERLINRPYWCGEWSEK